MKTYGDYLSQFFPDTKVQKISVDAGFTCPNRDGSISTGGCIYCRNDSFSPKYCDAKDSVALQLEKGRKFFGQKYPAMKYLAYFQSFTGTYNKPIEELSVLYQESINQKDVVGLVIATRPDCIPGEIVDLLSEINTQKPVFIELGAESSYNSTLRLINRNHTWEDVVNAANRIADEKMHVGIHLIAGLPGENKDMILRTIKESVKLPIETIKLHQLQVLKDTALAQKLNSGELTIPDFTLEEYLSLCADIVKLIPENIIIERFLSQSPPEMVISPSWGLKNYEFMTKLANLINTQNEK